MSLDSKKILIIEDDVKLRTQIKSILDNYGYKTVCVEDFQQVEDAFVKEAPDLVLLDINLPYYDGNYYCRSFRRKSKCPIIIISARNNDSDQILSIELGADDYLTKPFSIPVLTAKVNAVMRRNYGEYSNGEDLIFEYHGLLLDGSCFRISYQGKSEELSKNEYRLMNKLLQNPNKIISRDELLEEIWDDSTFVDDNTLNVNVTRLRLKLSNLGLDNVIHTKRKVGYLLVMENE